MMTVLPLRIVILVKCYANNEYKHLIPGLGHVKLQKLTAQMVQSFYAKKLRDGATASRVKNIHATLHTALEHARRIKLISMNVCADVQVPRREKPRQRPLTPEQAQLLLGQRH